LIGPPSIDWLGVPLKVHERTIGVVVIQSYAEGVRYGEQERDILTFVSTQVAVAIDRKRADEALRHAVTEHHHLEEQIRQAVKVEAVGRLAGGIAHDFNNILTAILGTTQLLQRELGPEAPHYADVEEIRRAAERAADLTRQLLAYSRRQVLAPRVLDLNAVVRGLDHMLRRLIGEDVELINVLAQQLAPVRADPGQVEQVIVNLAINARDAMPRGGKLTIETANIDLDAAFARAHPGAIPGSYVQLRVDDTGAGMDAETRAHLFEPFFTTKSVGKGTGLGLATVYGIVKQSGGYISVDSEPGRGTVFAIFLPRTTGTPEPPAGPQSPGQPARGTETILFVEDEETVRTLSVRALRRLGYQVLAAPGGTDALLVAKGHKGLIHMVLTDVVMPGLGGRELVRQLAVMRPEMKVLYISGYSDEAITQHGVLDPGTAFLQKPFTPDRLASKVREVLDAANAPLGAAKTP
jgi:signal transduction histidine kinase/ActR/RegA family two-component response regulator